jgi:hypothetical protein
MGKFYFHDKQRLLSSGSCPDGMEHLQPPPSADAVLVLGEAPCDALSIGVYEYWSIPDKCLLKKSVDADGQWAQVRHERDSRLTATDWTQLPDIPPATQLRWQPYRQALRDVTQQADPHNIVWPEAPL